MAFSAGFDGKMFYYQSGTVREQLLDATSIPPSFTSALLRHLPSLGADEEAMGASIILLGTMALDFDYAPQVLFIGTGGRSLFSHLAALLRMKFSAQVRDMRLVLVAGHPSVEERMVPEALIVDSVDALPAPAGGYDVIIVIDDGTFDASLVKHALAALRPGGHIFCWTSRHSVFAAAASAARGKMYPITEHCICFAGKTSKLRRKKHGRYARTVFPPLPSVPVRTMVFLPYKAAMWDCLESIRAVKAYGNAITAEAVRESVVRSHDGVTIDSVPPRDEMYVAKAPQSFYYGDIKRVYDHAQSEHRKSIDSAHLCSIYGLPLHMVRSTKNNLKITEPADYYIYRALYDAQENEQVIL